MPPDLIAPRQELRPVKRDREQSSRPAEVLVCDLTEEDTPNWSAKKREVELVEEDQMHEPSAS